MQKKHKNTIDISKKKTAKNITKPIKIKKFYILHKIPKSS